MIDMDEKPVAIVPKKYKETVLPTNRLIRHIHGVYVTRHSTDSKKAIEANLEPPKLDNGLDKAHAHATSLFRISTNRSLT